MAPCSCGAPSCGDCVPRITDAQFVKRAVCAAGSGRPRSFRWVHITTAFALGSGFARDLCQRFGLDPDELVGDAPETLGELAAKLEGAKPDPIAELLAHLAEQAGIRAVIAWDFQRRNPFTADCMGCGDEEVSCAEQGATGYPLCLDCYFQAVSELAPRAGDEPRAPWPVRWNTEAQAEQRITKFQGLGEGRKITETEAMAEWLDACKPAPGQSMGTLVVMRDGEPYAEGPIAYMTVIVDDYTDDETPEVAWEADYQIGTYSGQITFTAGQDADRDHLIARARAALVRKSGCVPLPPGSERWDFNLVEG